MLTSTKCGIVQFIAQRTRAFKILRFTQKTDVATVFSVTVVYSY